MRRRSTCCFVICAHFISGVAGDQCVLLTAIEARIQDYDVIVPADCVGSQTVGRNAIALRHLEKAHKVATPQSRGLRLRGPEARRPAA